MLKAGISDQIEPLNLLNMNSLGEPHRSKITEHDLLSSINFDSTGDHLCVGDRGGRIIVFSKYLEKGEEDFEYLTEFQAFHSDFDVYTNHSIPQTVTATEWLNHNATRSPKLLVSNQKQIKLFKLKNYKEHQIESAVKKLEDTRRLTIPKFKVDSEQKEGRLIASFKTEKE